MIIVILHQALIGYVSGALLLRIMVYLLIQQIISEDSIKKSSGKKLRMRDVSLLNKSLIRAARYLRTSVRHSGKGEHECEQDTRDFFRCKCGKV